MFAYCGNNPIVYTDSVGYLRTDISPCAMAYSGVSWKKDPLEEDRENYDFKNDDPDIVFDSTYFSSYKGALVIRHNDDYLTSWAIAGTIFLNHNVDGESRSYRERMLDHGYGHIYQEMDMSTPVYLVAVFLPSTIYNGLSRNSTWLYNNYYNMPWEYDADIRGGVNREHAPWARFVSDLYFSLFGVK